MAMNLLQAVESDLRALCAEAKKKQPAIKEVVERAILRLRNYRDQHSLNTGFPLEDVLRPILLAAESKNAKLAFSALSCVQRLLTHDVLAADAVPIVLNMLRDLVELSDEQLHLKVLQILLLLLNPKSLPLIEELTAQALTICFRLYGQKNPIVHNTAAATLRQIVTLLFDRVTSELDTISSSDATELKPSSPIVPTASPRIGTYATPSAASANPLTAHLPPHFRSAWLLFQDFCTVARGENGQWIATTAMSKPLALELIESILNSNPELFLTRSEFRKLLQENVCPLTDQLLAGPLTFSLAVRTVRIFLRLMQKFRTITGADTDKIVLRLIKLSDPENPLWLRTVIMEVMRIFCGDPQLLKSWFLAFDLHNAPSHPHLFTDVVHSFSTIISMTPIEADTPSQLTRFSNASNRPKLIEALTDHEPPALPEAFPLFLAIDSLIAVVETLTRLTDPNRLDLRMQKNTPLTEEQTVVQKMAVCSWAPILESLQMLVHKCEEETLIQYLLNAYQNFANACGSLALPGPRDAFLSSLCKLCLPHTKHNEDPTFASLTPKNIQACKVLLNIAHCLGGILDTRAWHLVLDTLDHLDRIIHDSRVNQATNAAIPVPPTSSSISAELNILANLLARLFESTRFLNDPALLDMLRALGNLTLQFLEQVATGSSNAVPTASPTVGPVSNKTLRMFAMTKMVDTALGNMDRVPLFWDLMVSELDCVANSKNVRIRQLGVESLVKLITAALSVKQEARNASSSNEEGLQKVRSYLPISQALLVTPLTSLARSSYTDTREKMVELLFQLLQTCGEDLKEGWPLLVQLVYDTGSDAIPSLIPTAFKSVELLVNDFLPSIPPASILTLVRCVGKYASQNTGVNISFTAVGMLWKVADYLKKEGQRLKRDYISEKQKPILVIEERQDEDENLPNTLETSSQNETVVATGTEDISSNTTPAVSLPLSSSFASPLPDISRRKSSKRLTVVATPPTDITDDPEEQRQQAEDFLNGLWLEIFRQLRDLCIDKRPEVRNCALHTLSSTLLTHGDVLEAIWQPILCDVLLTVLDTVSNAHRLSKDEQGPLDAGKQNLIVHHSRNTAEKQWDETRVLTLQTVARLFKTFFGPLKMLFDFPVAWRRVLEFVEDAILHYSDEVGSAAVRAVQELLQAQSGTDLSDEDRELWDLAWQVYERIGPHAEVSDKVLNSVVESLEETYLRCKSIFVSRHYLSFLSLLDQLMLCPGAAPSNPSAKSSVSAAPKLSPLQRSIFALLEKLPPFDNVDNWTAYYARLVAHISIPLSQLAADLTLPVGPSTPSRTIKVVNNAQQTSKTIQMDPQVPKPTADKQSLNQLALAQRSLALVMMTYEQASEAVRAVVFEDLLRVAGQLMQTRYIPSRTTTPLNLWKAGSEAFILIVKLGLPAFQHATTNEDAIARVWMVMTEVLQSVILPDATVTASLPLPVLQDIVKESEAVDIALVNLIVSDMIPLSFDIPSSLHWRLIALLDTGAALHGLGHDESNNQHAHTHAQAHLLYREAFAQACVKNLFLACADDSPTTVKTGASPLHSSLQSVDESSPSSGIATESIRTDSRSRLRLKVAKMAAPCLLARCADVLRRFAIDERQSGQMPLPRNRLQEVTFVLEHLKNLNMHPDVFTNAVTATNGSETPMSTSSIISEDGTFVLPVRGPKAHLLKLFPQLVDCVTSKEMEFKELLKDILHSVSRQLGLES